MPFDVQQQAVIKAELSPMSIVAGPGSGKTATLVGRIVHLIQQQLVTPEQILVISFTNKATAEMKQRLRAVLGETATQPLVTTFHGLAWQLLQHYWREQYLPPKQLLLEHDQHALVQQVLRQAKGFDLKIREALLLLTQQRADRSIAPSDFVTAYRQQLQQRHQIDFDDVLTEAVAILQDNPELQKYYQQRWQTILVDEMQDTNPVQLELLQLITNEQHTITVIGDPDQAIYGWRGGNVAQFLHWPERWPHCQQFSLVHNYRSQATIVQAAQAMIAHNQQRFPQTSLATKPAGLPIQLYVAQTDHQERTVIINTIEQLIGGSSHQQLDQDGTLSHGQDHHYSFGDIAVLFRYNELGRQLQQDLHRAGLPYQFVGDVDFFKRKDIRTVLALLAQQQLAAAPISQTIQTIIEPLQQQWTEQQRDHALQLLTLASVYDDLPGTIGYQRLLEQAALSRDEDYWNQQRDVITLLSVHAAKGLEFPIVFIIGLEEGLFPDITKSDLEEERRLLYVGMTRAHDQLYLSYAKDRLWYGEKQQPEPSRFLAEIPTQYLHTTVHQQRHKVKPADPQLKLL